MCGGGDTVYQMNYPDPAETAGAQYEYNHQAALDSAMLNAIDQYGPFGSTIWARRSDGTPYAQSVNLSPEVQQWLDSQFGASTELSSAALRQLGYLPQDRFQLPTGPTGKDYATQAFGEDIMGRMPSAGNIAQTSYEQAMSLQQPDIEAARKAKEIELAQRGIPIGSEIYNDEMNRLDRNEASIRNAAIQNAQLAAGQEETRQMNTALSAYGYGDTAYQQNLSNLLLERSRPYEEAAALLGTNPSFSTPNFMDTKALQIQSPDYTSVVNANTAAQASMAQAQAAANASKQSGLMSGIGSIGSALIGGIFSDEDLKENRKRVDGEHILIGFRELPVDDYDYKETAQIMLGVPEHRTGPMAQDYERVFPEGSDGHMIDMGDAVGKLIAAVKALDARTKKTHRGKRGGRRT